MRRSTPSPVPLPLLVAVCLIAAACRDGANGIGRKAGNYEVIEEGSAAGVTSTLHSPGEVITPPTQTMPDMTGTSLDTTTAFTILDPAIGTAPPAGTDTLAGTLPPVIDPNAGAVRSAPRPTTSRPVATSPRPSTPEPQPVGAPRALETRPEPVPIEEPDSNEPAVEEPPPSPEQEPDPTPGNDDEPAGDPTPGTTDIDS
jgi:hypothetical protein